MVFSKLIGCGSSTSSSINVNEHLHDGIPLVDEKPRSSTQSQETPALAYSPSYTFANSSDPASLAYDEFLKVYPGKHPYGTCRLWR